MDAEPTIPDGWKQGRIDADGERSGGSRSTSDPSDGGTELFYTRTSGDGPPLVISHGVFDDGLCRLPLVREFAEEYDVIAYDARGHGRSEAPDAGYGPEERADDLLGLIEALDLEDPILFGHSMGGDTTAAAAARRPDLPRAVVLVDPGGLLSHGDGGIDADAIGGQIAFWNDSTKEELLEDDDELRGHVEAGDEELASLLADARLRLDERILQVFEDGMMEPETTFPEIEVPTLVLRADVGEEARAADRGAVDRLPDGRLVYVDGAGHCVFRDECDRATAELREFLAGI